MYGQNLVGGKALSLNLGKTGWLTRGQGLEKHYFRSSRGPATCCKSKLLQLEDSKMVRFSKRQNLKLISAAEFMMKAR